MALIGSKTLTLKDPQLKVLREIVVGTQRVANMQKDTELVTICSEIITEIDNAPTHWPDQSPQESLPEKDTGTTRTPSTSIGDEDW